MENDTFIYMLYYYYNSSLCLDCSTASVSVKVTEGVSVMISLAIDSIEVVVLTADDFNCASVILDGASLKSMNGLISTTVVIHSKIPARRQANNNVCNGLTFKPLEN